MKYSRVWEIYAVLHERAGIFNKLSNPGVLGIKVRKSEKIFVQVTIILNLLTPALRQTL
jgi:hypothetical protein